MTTVEVYAKGQTGVGEPLATLSYSGKNKECTIETSDDLVKDELEQFVDTILYLPKRGRAYPTNRQVWMESLPVANISVPYWFKIVDSTSEITEEVNDANEDIEEDIEEDGEESEGDGGGSGNPNDEGNSDGGLLNHNG
tara:strand:+ start:552 stop:968 length:417 start_codon:yes stop_codon:yes gene_type:complete